MPMQLALKYIVFTQLVLSAWAQFAGFLGASYFYVNLCLTGLGVWVLIDKHTIEGFTSFGAVYVFSILNDLMCVGVWAKSFNITNSGDPNLKFSLAMAIINILTKFAFLYFLWIEHNSRGSAHVEGSHTAPLNSGAYDPMPQAQIRAYDPLHAADPLAAQTAAHAAANQHAHASVNVVPQAQPALAAQYQTPPSHQFQVNIQPTQNQPAADMPVQAPNVGGGVQAGYQNTF